MKLNLYGLIVGIGVWAAWEASLRFSRRIGVDSKIVNKMALWAILGGIIGARAYHVIDLWSRYYSIWPIRTLLIWQGGLGIWGAIVGGVVGITTFWFVKLRKKVGFLNLSDIAFIGAPLGQAIGRWGNFFNKELLGKNREPLFLYESISDLVLFGILWTVSKRMSQPGFITGLYLVGYGLIRFFLEPLRSDEVIWRIDGLPAAQMFAGISVAVGLFLIQKTREGEKTSRVGKISLQAKG